MRRIVGFDPSLRNWGMASVWVEEGNPVLSEIDDLQICQPKPDKTLAPNMRDLKTAQRHFTFFEYYAKHCHAICAELPHGSQSSRAMASYGVCLGVLGSLAMASGVPLITLTAREVKEQAVGDPNASKEQMVEWATQFGTSYEDMWPTHRGQIVMGKAEHMADALGAINAAINLEKLPRGF